MTMPGPRGQFFHGTSLKDTHDTAASKTLSIPLAVSRQDAIDVSADLRPSLDAVIS